MIIYGLVEKYSLAPGYNCSSEFISVQKIKARKIYLFI
jgi:hypothetical protein